MSPGRLGWFAAAMLLLVAACITAWLGIGRPTRAPAPGFAPEAFLPTIEPGGRYCDPGETVPAGARGVEITLGAFGRERGTSVEIIGLRGDRVLIRGEEAFRENQDVFVPFASPVLRTIVLDLCVRNTGSSPIQLGGKPGFGASFRYPGADRETWLEAAPQVAARFRYVRVAPIGVSSVWLFLSFAVVAVLVGVVGVLAATRR